MKGSIRKSKSKRVEISLGRLRTCLEQAQAQAPVVHARRKMVDRTPTTCLEMSLKICESCMCTAR